MSDTRFLDVGLKYSELGLKQPEIANEMHKYEELLRQFCDLCKLDYNRIELNVRALKEVIIRVDMRKLYFKVYHDMVPNEYKLTALEGFWFLKLHPLWMPIQQDDTEEMMQLATCINERFVLHMICGAIMEFKPDFFESDCDLVRDYCKELEYSFRYRDLSKESLFLMFDPFYYLHLYSTAVTREGNPVL